MGFGLDDVSSWLIGGLFLVLVGWTVRTTAVDARRRGKSPLLVCLLVFLSFPLGLIVWLVFRPARLNGVSAR
jgi:hypothetical protein